MLEKYKVKLATIDGPSEAAQFNLPEDTHLLCRLNNGAMWISPKQLPGQSGYVITAGQIVPDNILTEGARGEAFPITLYKFTDDYQNRLTARAAKGMPIASLGTLLKTMHENNPDSTAEEAMAWIAEQVSNVTAAELKNIKGDGISLEERAARVAEAVQDGFAIIRFFGLDAMADELWDDMRTWRK